jgi:hypothetical protein
MKPLIKPLPNLLRVIQPKKNYKADIDSPKLLPGVYFYKYNAMVEGRETSRSGWLEVVTDTY